MDKNFSLNKRGSGIMLHPTSLPGSFGVGDLGPEAFRFADFLASSGQSWWQTFPLGPTGYGRSPYQTLSVFAGNPILISLEKIAKKGWLKSREIQSSILSNSSRADFERAEKFKNSCLYLAFEHYEKYAGAKEKSEFEKFSFSQSHWLNDFACFMALKKEFQGAPWWHWDKNLRNRQPGTVEKASKFFQLQIRFQKFLQYLFFQQWRDLKEYCLFRAIGFIGDVPIFLALDSADVWGNQKLFNLDNKGQPVIVAGVPPDYFSKTGQRWGNPLYRWAAHKNQHFDWWIRRFKMAFTLFDAVRLDHFIGYKRFWAIPSKEKTAVKGKWLPGPGSVFFKSVLKRLGPREFIAEDLGQVTKEVIALREEFKFPGMRILQFAFGNNKSSKFHLPHNYPKNCLVYPGTHDNDTIVGWFRDKGSASSTRSKKQIREEIKFALEYMKSNGREVHWDMIRLALMSVANTAILQTQDILGLGSEGRMNRPGKPMGNWSWRLKPKDLNQNVSKRLYYLTKIADRLPSSASLVKLNS